MKINELIADKEAQLAELRKRIASQDVIIGQAQQERQALVVDYTIAQGHLEGLQQALGAITEAPTPGKEGADATGK